MTDFRTLLGPAVDQLAQKSYQPGQTIFRAGEPGDTMFVILEGRVTILLAGLAIDQLQAGSIFGEMALVDSGVRSASALALDRCRLAPVDRRLFSRLVQQVPDFATQVMVTMSGRLRRLVDEQARLLRLEEELRIARQIQQSLLPAGCPAVPGWDFAAAYRAAREVGGDLYDFIRVPEDPARLYFVIADVTGKGVPAAIYMAASRNTMRSEAMRLRGPAEALSHANRVFSEDAVARLFLSACYVCLETGSGRLTYGLAGHEQPLWYRAATGRVRPLEAKGVVLGAFPAFTYEEHTITVAPSDSLVFFTDGVTEARNAAGELLGDDRLLDVVASAGGGTASALLEAIAERVSRFVGHTPQSDDLTMVVFHRAPSS
jgi:serine phosphatase RsbU (regulator of sigma subunit)